MIRAKIRENTMISTIWGLSSLFFPLCVCMIPQTKWVGKVQAQFTEENILYSSQQAGLLSVKQNQQRDLSHRGGRHCAASLWPQRLNRQAVKGTLWTGHAEGAATRACAPRPPNTHTHDFLSNCYFFSPEGQESCLDISLWRVIIAETFPRKQPPACALLLWHWLELFNLFGCYCNQMTALTLNNVAASLLRGSEAMKGKSQAGVCTPAPPPQLFSFLSGSAAFSSFV